MSRIPEPVFETLETRLLLSNVLSALASFNDTNGAYPFGDLVADSAGNFYGTCWEGGADHLGTVFEVVQGSGAITTLATFNQMNGSYPEAGLIIDSAGNLYGTAVNGGSIDADGCVFEVVKGSGAITVLAAFHGANGKNPQAGVIMDAAGNLFGTTAYGGPSDNGTVFEVVKGSGAITTLASFNSTNGAHPQAGLVMDGAGNLYGTAANGGPTDDGAVFEVVKSSGAITTLAFFNGTNGVSPEATLLMDAAGNLYGTTYGGGPSIKGTVFEVVQGSGAITTLASFNGTNGAYPQADLTMDAAGNLYGTTRGGGGSGEGTLFEIVHGSGAITVLDSFRGINGANPQSGLIVDSNGYFYGTTYSGGATGVGTVFEYGPYPPPTVNSFGKTVYQNATLTFSPSDFTAAFSDPEGYSLQKVMVTSLPGNGALQLSGVAVTVNQEIPVAQLGNLTYTPSSGYIGNDSFGWNGWDGTAYAIVPAAANAAVILHHSLTTVASFNGSNGNQPWAGLTMDGTGNLYGTTAYGGGNGTVFEIAQGTGTVTVLATFGGVNGNCPCANLIVDGAGNLYGTTYFGGAFGDGVVFEVVKGSGAITVLGTFNNTNGNGPFGNLAMDGAGNLYGTTTNGGTNDDGVVFEWVKSSGTIATLATFNGTNGTCPTGGVMMDAAGNLYGTAQNGGANDDGVVFEWVKASGTLTTLATFNGTNGSIPVAGVVMDAAGNLYGTTYSGGAGNDGTVFEVVKGSGTVTTLATFNGANGSNPKAGVIRDASGNLYGTTYQGGVGNDGTVFEVVKGSGTISSLASFSGANGNQPWDGGLVLDSTGNLYGTTHLGGANNDGTVFELLISPVPNPPTNLIPSNGATGVGLTPTLSASAFSETGPLTQYASQWVVTRVSDGTVVWDSGTDTTDTNSATVPAGRLATYTAYSWRAHYEDTDGAWGNYSTATVFTAAPVPAVVAATGTTLAYSQGAGAVRIDPGVTVTDADNPPLASATVWISGNFASGQDVLAFTNQNGITGSYNASTGVMTLSGASSVANYQTALESMTFRNSSATPSTLQRTVSFKVNDGYHDSNVASRAMDFIADVAPVMTTTATALNYLQMNGPAAVDSGVTVTDSDSTTFAGATVSITGNFAGAQDVLAFTNQNGITGSYNASTGVLTLTGSSSVANYQAALASVTYANTSGTPSLLERTVSFRVNDGILPSNIATRAVDITPDAVPVVTTTAAPLNFYQANGWAVIDSGVTVSDSDSANLAGAWVWISGNFAGAQDVLGFVNQSGITGSYNASTGVMTLTGASSVANYQIALRTVAYANTGNPPSVLQRTFSFRVNDGAVNSNTATRAVNITADAVPVVTTTATPLRYVDGDGWVNLDAGVSATDADSATLNGASIWISSGYVNGQDVLGFTNQNGITGSWNAATGTMTLSGTSSVANYQTALRSVGYYWITASGTPAARTISFQLSDGLRTSAVATRTVNIAKLAADAYEYNDASWSGTAVTLNDSGVGAAANASIFAATGADTDWYRFTVPYGATGDVAVTVGNVGGGLKAHIGLYDSILGTLADQVPSLATLYGPKAQIDGSTANGTVTLNYSGLAAGSTWYIKVTGNASTHGVYDLGVATAMMAPDALEANNTSGTASGVTSNLVSGNGACCLTSLSLHRSNDEDWFRIDTPANTDGNLVATVSHLTAGLQGLVWVYQHYTWGDVPMGIGVYASWTPGGAGTATIYNAQPNTTYFIRVDNFWAETGGYQLDVTLPLDAQAKDAYESGAGNNVSWLAHPLTLTGNSATVNSLTIHNTADQDWFSFMPTTNGNVTITVSGVSGGLVTHVGLYDSVIGSLADQYGGVFTTLFGPKATQDALSTNQTVRLSFSGLHAWTTYYVKISGLTSTTGLYTLGVAFTPAGSTGDLLSDAAPSGVLA